MEHRVSMGVGRTAAVALVLAVSVAGVVSCAFSQIPTQNSATTKSGQDTSSSNPKSHRHHTTVEEQESPSPELSKAEELIQKKDFTQAESLLQKLVQSDGSNYVAWFDLAFVENGLGKTDESIAAYKKSVEAKPDVFESNLNLGLQLAKTGGPDAEKYLRAATQLKPTNHVAEGQARAWLSLAHVLEATKSEEAIAAYHKAALLQPKDVEPHLSAGLLLEKENKFSDAEQEYKESLAIDPSSSDAITGLANIYMRGRRFPEAEAELRKIVAADPKHVAGRVQLGRVLVAEGKKDDAIAELEAAAKMVPGDLSLQRELADLYVSTGKNKEAESIYRQLVAAHESDAELHQALGRCLFRQKKYPEAQKELVRAVQLKPDSNEAYIDLAFVAGENKDYPLVLRALDARAKTSTEVPVAYFLRASAYDNLKDVKKATENYRLFLQAANGKYPDQEWQAKHRLIALEPKR